MKNRLMPASATFIATIDQMPRIALKTTRRLHATRLISRNRSTRACISDHSSSADPTQPSASIQLTSGRLLGGSAGPVVVGEHGRQGPPRWVGQGGAAVDVRGQGDQRLP